MVYKKFIYRLSPEDFYELLTNLRGGVEILSEGESFVEFALYEPLEGLEPLDVTEVKVVKPYFRPFRVKDFLVVPQWLLPLHIRQASAFGTGLHPSTRLCLELIWEHFQQGWSAIDVGTGTGILAIAMKKKGASKVLAIDIDPSAVEECRQNVKSNCVEVECRLADPREVKEVFDFLVANLELRLFKDLMPELLGLFEKRAVFSGLYGKEELKEFKSLLKG
ncbi:MAG: methyltransferase domain-containing protein, partial [Aquificota bacterium]